VFFDCHIQCQALRIRLPNCVCVSLVVFAIANCGAMGMSSPGPSGVEASRVQRAEFAMAADRTAVCREVPKAHFKIHAKPKQRADARAEWTHTGAV